MDNSNICSVEKLTETIKLMENLRSTVYVVFDELVGGKTINDGIKDHRTINDKEKGTYLQYNTLNLHNFLYLMLIDKNDTSTKLPDKGL